MVYYFKKKDCLNLLDYFLQKHHTQTINNCINKDLFADDLALHIGSCYVGSFLWDWNSDKYNKITATEEMLEDLKDEALVEFAILRMKGETKHAY